MKYAHENGCPWDENTVDRAAYVNDLSVLNYALENGCQWPRQFLYGRMNDVAMELLYQYGCRHKWLVQQIQILATKKSIAQKK